MSKIVPKQNILRPFCLFIECRYLKIQSHATVSVMIKHPQLPLSKGKLRTMILLDLCGNKTRIRKYSVIFPEERQYTKERDLVHDNHQYDEDDHNSTADHSFYWFRHKLLLPGSFH